MSTEMGGRRWPSYGHALATRLRKIRTLRGLSQEELAELSGISRNTISNFERNENNRGTEVDPRLSTLYDLAFALQVPPMALMPAAGELVANICVDEQLGIDVRWPTEKDGLIFEADSQLNEPRSEEDDSEDEADDEEQDG
ncbi:helix-turn-helix transcriptional regulator [Corynebacterium callunae]|uniref:helix-turn-helix domain-containing protein n=1 Tax=Corynebacterium callunae TaxID=1721 RepID=UPI003981D517